MIVYGINPVLEALRAGRVESVGVRFEEASLRGASPLGREESGEAAVEEPCEASRVGNCEATTDGRSA